MPTIYDVAKKASVSPSTVSRVFNNYARISDATRQKVLAAAADLNYQPTVLGSALVTKQTLMIGLVTSDIQNPYAATLARGVQDMLDKQGYVTIICNTDGDSEKEVRVLREIHRRGVDGFIITPSQFGQSDAANAYIRQLLKQGDPIVFIGNRLDDPEVDFVTSRAQDGALQAVNYLAELGHQNIGFIGGRYTEGVAVGRWLGYQEALIAHKRPIRPDYMIEADLSRDGGHIAMHQFLALAEPPSAVLTVNDLMAIGALTACYEENIQVPDQMSIIGFDDIPMAELTIPPLTTVAQPAYDLGYRAAGLLLKRIQNPDTPPQNVLLQSTLIVRGSTAKL